MPIACPMPGDAFIDSIVIASGTHLDPNVGEPGPVVFGLLVLNQQAPYYSVLEVVSQDAETISQVITIDECNIVPAAHVFNEMYGFWGGGALSPLGQGAPAR